MNVPKKLDDETVEARENFFDELDGKPATRTQSAYAKLKKAMQNVGLGLGGSTQSGPPNQTQQQMNVSNNIGGAGITGGTITGQINLRPFATSSSFMIPTGPPGMQHTTSGPSIGYATPPQAPGLYNKTTYRMVMGLVIDEDTGKQKYVTKAYFCIDAREAKRNFISEYPELKFTAVFVMEPVEDD